MGDGGYHLPGRLVPPGQGGGADGRGDHDVPGRAAGTVVRFGPWGLAKLRCGVSTGAFVVVAAAVGWGCRREGSKEPRLSGRRLALWPVDGSGYFCCADAEQRASGALFVVALR